MKALNLRNLSPLQLELLLAHKFEQWERAVNGVRISFWVIAGTAAVGYFFKIQLVYLLTVGALVIFLINAFLCLWYNRQVDVLVRKIKTQL